MSELLPNIATLNKPYNVTRSRLGAITKVYSTEYICDVKALKQVIDSITEKLSNMQGPIEVSLIISYADNTHHDFGVYEINSFDFDRVDKVTDRIVIKWVLIQHIDNEIQELSVILRLANPINPLILFQAALTKSANDIDNLDFEIGTTCITVDGAIDSTANEFFLRVSNWINARAKYHVFLDIRSTYLKFKSLINFFNSSIIPLVITLILSHYASRLDIKNQIALTPSILGAFLILQHAFRTLNNYLMSRIYNAYKVNLFSITSGDRDNIAKISAKSWNNIFKAITLQILSIATGVIGSLIAAKLWNLL